MKQKLIYIISDIDKALAFEWMVSGLKERFDLSFILIAKERSEFSSYLKNHSIPFYEINNSLSRIIKWRNVFLILHREKPSVVHTHLWQANVLGLSAAWLLRVNRRIYTRHHATVHYHEFPAGRKWDILCNTLATDIIAISQNIKDILIAWDKADSKKIKLIPHGFDFNYFKSVDKERIEFLRAKYNIQRNSSFPVIGVISRYVQWKGVQYIIPAFRKIRKQYPAAKLILANANGDYASTLKELLQTLPEDSYIQISFEEDLAALYQLFDVYVHVPIDPYVEAFGQTYVESMAAGIPSVFTLSGKAPEFVVHKSNAWVVDFKNSDQIAQGIKVILSDIDLVNKIKFEAEKSIRRFSLEAYLLALEKLYTDKR